MKDIGHLYFRTLYVKVKRFSITNDFSVIFSIILLLFSQYIMIL